MFRVHSFKNAPSGVMKKSLWISLIRWRVGCGLWVVEKRGGCGGADVEKRGAVKLATEERWWSCGKEVVKLAVISLLRNFDFISQIFSEGELTACVCRLSFFCVGHQFTLLHNFVSLSQFLMKERIVGQL